MQEIQQYARLGQQAKQYYDRNTSQPEVKKKKTKTKKIMLISPPSVNRSLI